MFDGPRTSLSVAKQCDLLSLPRSALYYKAQKEASRTVEIMHKLDEEYLKTPFYGSRKLSQVLSGKLNTPINRKRIQRLMRRMGIVAVYPKPDTSRSNRAHKKYPYLLSGISISRPNQVWSSDITYIRLGCGYAYLMAVIDWYSRKVLSWRLSNTLDASFCVEALKEALSGSETPEIFNTDQGSQFTSDDFIKVLKSRGIKISMDGKGRALDNVITERLWRSVKYENVYMRGYQTLSEAKAGIGAYLEFYNRERVHQSLAYRTPEEVHCAKID